MSLIYDKEKITLSNLNIEVKSLKTTSQSKSNNTNYIMNDIIKKKSKKIKIKLSMHLIMLTMIMFVLIK
jgi:hypothetical protein